MIMFPSYQPAVRFWKRCSVKFADVLGYGKKYSASLQGLINHEEKSGDEADFSFLTFLSY